MQTLLRSIYRVSWLVLSSLVLYFFSVAPETALAASALYWCPQRPADQQYSAAPGPGCTPLVEKSDKPAGGVRAPHKEIKAENLQTEISNFLREYRRFLDCCSTDIASLDDLKELEDRANHLLLTAQTVLFSEQMKLRGFTLREIIPPVAQARDNLKTLKSRLEAIEKAKEKMDELGYEAAGREQRRIRDEEEAIKKDFRPALSPESARTGTEIGDTTLPNRPGTLSQDTTVPNVTGTDFGNTTSRSSTGTDVGTTPPTGTDIGQTPSTGFEIGTTGRVGPAVGDSDLNKR
jgi:hypothetical protein